MIEQLDKYASVIIILILIYVFYIIITKINRYNKIKKETIISNVGEPYLMEDSISPFSISLTSDIDGQNGGLSYLKLHTDTLNNQLIHDYYKDSYNINLPKDTKIILGGGTTMMIAALYYALQKKENRSINVNTNHNIFYLLHEKLTFPAKKVEWVNSNEYSDLAVIVSPSNPLGIITEPNSLKQKYQLYDVVYDKYLFTGKHTSVNNKLYEEFSTNKDIFITSSFSKLGLAGARFGFLLTRDDDIAKFCEEYVNILSVRYPTTGATVSRIAYYKYFKNHNWQNYIYNTIKSRREFFIKTASKHGINILYKNNIVPYIYTNKSTTWWLTNFNVETRKGSDFNDTDNNSRFNLMISQEYWDEFVRRFTK
jgi:aspartate/methionine/tyrosine aminotransferase